MAHARCMLVSKAHLRTHMHTHLTPGTNSHTHAPTHARTHRQRYVIIYCFSTATNGFANAPQYYVAHILPHLFSYSGVHSGSFSCTAVPEEEIRSLP